MANKSVLLDTSFFIRFLNEEDPLFKNADGYFRYFLENDIAMMISTISIAEYCVGGKFTELPLKNLQIVPFNLEHSKRTGEFAKIIFSNKRILKIKERNIIPNDSKLFAQADCEKVIEYYITSDTESQRIYDLLKKESDPKFQFIDLSVPYSQTFGILDFD